MSDPTPPTATQELTQTLNAALKTALDGLASGVEFAKGQIPLVLQEKLAYDFYSALFFLLSFLLLALGAFCWCRYAMRQARNSLKDNYGHSDKDEWTFAAWFPTCIAWVVSLIGILINADTLINIHFAPRLYIMEWLLKMVKR